MKIALVVDDSLDSSDGVQQYVLTVGRWLVEHNHDVHYITSTTSRQLSNLHVVSKKVRVKFNKNTLGIPLPASRKNLRSLVTQQDFDVVHIQMPYSPVFSGKLIKELSDSTALVGTFHIAPFSKFHEWGGRVLQFMTKRSQLRFDDCVSVSSVAQRYAEKTFNLKTVVVPNAVDIARFKSSSQTVPRRIVFLGRLVERKGCRQLLHIARKMRELGQDFELIIVGDGQQRTMLEKYVNDHDLQSVVNFEGFVSEKRKQELLSSATIAVFPALGGESFGIVLIEAMAAGSKVVLAGNNPGYVSVMGSIEDALIEPDKITQTAHSMITLLNDKQLQDRIHEKQQRLVKRFDIDVVGPQILEHYRKAIEKRSRKVHNTK